MVLVQLPGWGKPDNWINKSTQCIWTQLGWQGEGPTCVQATPLPTRFCPQSAMTHCRFHNFSKVSCTDKNWIRIHWDPLEFLSHRMSQTQPDLHILAESRAQLGQRQLCGWLQLVHLPFSRVGGAERAQIYGKQLEPRFMDPPAPTRGQK